MCVYYRHLVFEGVVIVLSCLRCYGIYSSSLQCFRVEQLLCVTQKYALFSLLSGIKPAATRVSVLIDFTAKLSLFQFQTDSSLNKSKKKWLNSR